MGCWRPWSEGKVPLPLDYGLDLPVFLVTFPLGRVLLRLCYVVLHTLTLRKLQGGLCTLYNMGYEQCSSVFSRMHSKQVMINF
jgi:hypothetical protein